MLKSLFAAGLLLIGILTACSPSQSASSVSTVIAPTLSNSADNSSVTSTPSPLEAAARAAADRPAWLTTPLINATTGQTFTLADFPNKTVYVELMATWCTNCRQQQGNVRTVMGQLGQQDYQFISLSVEPKDTTAALATYLKQYNYPWTFAIVPKDMLAALVKQFGASVTNPTATPHFIISPSGAISQLSTGIKSVADLSAALTTASGA